jgi:hypothetical protein
LCCAQFSSTDDLESTKKFGSSHACKIKGKSRRTEHIEGRNSSSRKRLAGTLAVGVESSLNTDNCIALKTTAREFLRRQPVAVTTAATSASVVDPESRWIEFLIVDSNPNLDKSDVP